MFQRDRYIYDLEARNNAFYFATEKGFCRFDIAEGRTEKVAGNPSMWGSMSLGGEKLAFVRYYYAGKWRGFAQLRIMNADGTEERPLVGTENEESPLHGGYIYPVRVSPRGDKVAFIARYVPKSTSEELWVVNSDGSGLKGYDLGIADAEHYLFIKFMESDRWLFVICTTKIKPGSKDQRAGAVLVRVNLESGQVETLSDQVRKPYAASMQGKGMISRAGLIAFIHYDEAASKEILTVLDPRTLDKRQVYPEGSVIGLSWDIPGDNLAFLTDDHKLGVYSTAEGKIVQIKEITGYDLRWPSEALEWTPDGRIILRRIEGMISSICLLDGNLTEQKAIRLPFNSHYASRIWSAGKYAVIENTERHQLWGLDLTTEKWTRIY
jgi:hypothetical protein